jgi:hypothetical protein
MLIPELLQYIFEGKQHFLSAEFETWMKRSRRFRAFAETHRAKIRKKLRNLRDEQGLRDVYVELATAHWLSSDLRFTIEYEQYGLGKVRAPDFTVTFRTHTLFNVEVTRLRVSRTNTEAVDLSDLLTNKLMEAVCDKLGQMPPSSINLLMITSDVIIPENTLIRALTQLRALAEQKEELYFMRRSFENARDFLRQFARLSAVANWHSPNGAVETVWNNALAKHPLPKELLNVLKPPV